MFDLQDFHERSRELTVGQACGAPGLQAGGKIATSEPMGCQSESALGMVGRALPMEMPETAWQDAILVLLPVAPPAIPDAAEIALRYGSSSGDFVREQIANAEQACLEIEKRK